MQNRVASQEAQALTARYISLSSELDRKSQELKQAVLQSEQAHVLDLLTASTQKVAALEAELDRVKAQKRSLCQQLAEATRSLETCFEEIQHTNEELGDALNSNPLPLRKATELSKTLLDRGDPPREALATLLSSIYRSSIQPWELQPYLKSTHAAADRLDPASRRWSSKRSSRGLQMSLRHASLSAQARSLQAKTTMLIEQSQKMMEAKTNRVTQIDRQ